MKKVLFIAFIFPPLGGSGVQRTLKFTKYLPGFEWKPYVVCCDDPNIFNDGLDPSLLDEIPDEAVTWRRPFISPINLRKFVTRSIKSGFVGHTEARNQQKASHTVDQSIRSPFFHQIIKNINNFMLRLLAPVEFPPVDASLYWSLSIIPGCINLIKKEKIDLVFTTSFPYSDHITGLILKKLTGLPWVADFRDPWTQNASATNKGWRLKIDSWIEKIILKTADRIISVTPSYTQDFSNLAPTRSPHVFITIENGFDSSDVTGLNLRLQRRNPSGQKIILSHVGMIYQGTAIPFLQALVLLGEQGSKLHCNFIGGLAAEESEWINSHEIFAKISVKPRVEHSEAVRIMMESDFLLLVFGGSEKWKGHYPGKLFEYMASQTPIILIGPEGDTAKIIEESRTGIHLPSNQVERITTNLKDLLENPISYRKKFFQPKMDVIKTYERRNLSGRLVNVFNELVSR